MAEQILAAVRLAPSQTELREFPMPDIPPEGGLLAIEAAGVCGADVHSYPRELPRGPEIMGHENVGHIAQLGKIAAERWGLKEGDRVALEEYLPCGHCEWCRSGDYRVCPNWTQVDGQVVNHYGRTPMSVPPALWGGFAQYMYLHPNTVFHKIPAHIPAEQAALAIAFGNGWQWAYMDAGVRPGMTVVIQGPGQQGLGCVIASKEAGADCIIVSGLSRDAQRLEVARHLGADYTIDVEKEDFCERVREITQGEGAHVVVDVATGGPDTILPAIDVLRRRGVLVVVSLEGTVPISVGTVTRNRLTLKFVGGHSYQSVELALRTIASGKYPVHEVSSHQFRLDQVDLAIRSTGGVGEPGTIHATVLPGKGAQSVA